MNIDGLKDNYAIDPNLYDKHEVNRGLRKKNGTGVLIGLTRVGDVHGYELVNGVKTAVSGRLFYRGIDISDIVGACLEERRFGFEETIHTILLGKLPTKQQLDEFSRVLRKSQKLPDGLMNTIKTMPGNNLMNKLARGILESHLYAGAPESQNLEIVVAECLDLVARFPIILAHAYNPKSRMPDSKLGIAENFLHMLRPNKKVTVTEARALDIALILHAEHGGGNNSTFTVRVVSSTGTDTYSAIAAALGALKGPKHGGANEAVLGMMREIKANVKDWTNRDEVKNYLIKIIKKQAGDKSGLIYGIGHAIYTVTDPRTAILKEQAALLAKEKNREAEMQLYAIIEELAPRVFAEVKGSDKAICANVDFYSGFLYDMLGIPEELCTPIFAASRIVGWCAHRIDELINGGKIIRPAYRDVGKRVDYIPIAKRK